MNKLVVIIYTTLYRKGGDKFNRVAKTLSRNRKKDGCEVVCRSVESKAALKEVFQEINDSQQEICEFHFVGHSGMYGPMFGTISYPEQLSPYELKNLNIPFANNATASFHCCRSARWFAPYFARVQNVKSFGYYWYTTFSAREDRYQLPTFKSNTSDLFCFGCPGKKSHGLLASLKKITGLMKAEDLKEFDKPSDEVDTSYNEVADLYANTFQDIKVRKDEYNWLMKKLPNKDAIKMLDIGCGNGALLNSLHDKLKKGVGVDVSENLLSHARELNRKNKHIDFKKIDGPILPFEDNSFDLVVSLLSFRYLDWDPIMAEVERVLEKDGQLIIIDMVTAPLRIMELPMFFISKMRHYLDRYRHRTFYDNLKKLVTHKGWSKMLNYNPIRSQHEMKWYLESRFPNRKVDVINIGLHSRILAFNSENMHNISNINLSYP